jgi:tyrosine-protein phosphatase SIW14
MQYRSLPVLFFGLWLGLASAASPEAPGVPNFHQVNEHVFRGGQPADSAWTSLASLGIKLIVDLRPATEHPTQSEQRAVEAAGMRYVNIPMKSLGTPFGAAVLKVLALMESESNGPVFVHCKRGADRTGTVIACYRVLHDHWENQKALQEARALGMYAIERGMMHYILNFNPATAPLTAGVLAGSSSDQP